MDIKARLFGKVRVSVIELISREKGQTIENDMATQNLENGQAIFT